MHHHTPGPWQRFDNGGTLNDAVTMAYGPSYADCVWGPKGPGYGLIADCSPHGQSPTAETIANARLIAAAPNLLEALEQIERWSGDLPGGLVTLVADALSSVRGETR